jgi:predicted O-methyltransferase YrrM
VNIIYEYIKYIAKAKGRHHIHSPFVFELVDVCFNLRVATNDKKTLNNYLSALYSDKKTYIFDTYGAGSKSKKTHTTIKSLAQKASTKGKYWELLYRISKHYKSKNILELGTNFGLGTLAFKLGNPFSFIKSIEGSNTLIEINRNNFNNFKLNNIDFIQSTFEEFFKQRNDLTYDLVFIDGDHIGKNLLTNLDKTLQNCHNETLIIIDDIRWSTDMLAAWEQIITDKRFHLTIDLFKLGIILLKTDKEKEHFILKY